MAVKITKFLLAWTFSFVSCVAFSQEAIVWGSQVLDVSTEFEPLEYSAIQALHKPNVLPLGGKNPNAWRPKRQDKEEFITVQFDKPIKAQQVAIAESENPGAVTAVIAYDKNYNPYELFRLSARALPIETRLLNLFFQETAFEVLAIKVIMDCSVVPGFNSIDAIGISDSNIPINVLIDLAKGVSGKVESEKLGKNVNSTYVEHSPIISPDGKRLYFSRKYHPENSGGVDDPEDIWMSEWDEASGEWLPAKNVGPPLNNPGPNFISSISVSPEGEDLLMLGNRYGKKGRMYAGVSTATYKDGAYTTPQSVEVENEYNYSPKADFFLSPGGDVLIQSIERDESNGGRDLYVSFKRQGTLWSEPINMGTDLNTAAEEAAPFLAQDGKTLYYSSNGFSGYGGLDIFVTRRLDDSWTKWSIPDNLGTGINTDLDDQYFSIPTSGDQLYFTRGNVDDDTDIFTFKVNDFFVDPEDPIAQSVGHLMETAEEKPVLVQVKGKVVDSKTGQPMANVPVNIERLPDGLKIGTVTSDEDGNYEITLRPGARFGIAAESDGYLAENQNIDLNDKTEAETIELPLNLSPIEKGAPIVINNIFFAVNKAELTTSSYAELQRILDLMISGKIAKIEVSGHTSSDGSKEFNYSLSRKRANAVYSFFIDNGVEENRMESVGYGPSKPVASNNTLEGRKKNRRVEFKVLETGS